MPPPAAKVQRTTTTPSTHRFAALIAHILDHPRGALLLLLLAAGAALTGLPRLRIDFSSEAFYASDHASKTKLDLFRDAWGPDDDELLVVIQIHEGSLLDRGPLEVIQQVADELAATAGVHAVHALPGQPMPRADHPASEYGESVLQSRVARDRGDRQALEDWRRDLMRSASLVPLFISRDQKHSAMIIELRTSSDRVEAIRPTLAEVTTRLRERSLSDGITYHVAGIPAVRVAFTELVIHDQKRLGPLTLMLAGFLLLVFFHRTHAVLIPALAAAYPLLILLGVMGASGIAIGLLNQALFTILPVLAVADAVHWVARFHEEAAREENATAYWTRQQRRATIVSAGSHVAQSCSLTTLTTAAGFFSLLATDIPLLREFGLLAGGGIIVAYLSALVIVPISLDRVSGRPSDRRRAPERKGAQRRLPFPHSTLERCARLVTTRPRLVIALGISVISTAAILAQNIRVDNSLMSLLQDNHPVRTASRLADEQLGGVFSLELDVRSQDQEPFNGEFYAEVERFEGWVRQQPSVRVVLYPGMGERPAEDDPWLRDGGRRARISIRTENRGAQAFEALARDIEDELERRDWAASGYHVALTGSTYLAYQGVNRITHELQSSFVLVLAVVMLVISVLFRSLRVALITAPANIGPLLVGLGTIGWVGWVLDPLSAVILALAIGIAVDDTIHLLARVREELASGHDLPIAVRNALTGCGRALIVTTLVLSAGLSVNLLSSFPPLAQLGLLGSVVMLAALVFDLLLLPACFIVFPAAIIGSDSGRRGRQRPRDRP
ncbi:MAG: MMPL family transporter [Nannocystaceae bacterium]